MGGLFPFWNGGKIETDGAPARAPFLVGVGRVVALETSFVWREVSPGTSLAAARLAVLQSPRRGNLPRVFFPRGPARVLFDGTDATP